MHHSKQSIEIYTNKDLRLRWSDNIVDKIKSQILEAAGKGEFQTIIYIKNLLWEINTFLCKTNNIEINIKVILDKLEILFPEICFEVEHTNLDRKTCINMNHNDILKMECYIVASWLNEYPKNTIIDDTIIHFVKSIINYILSYINKENINIILLKMRIIIDRILSYINKDNISIVLFKMRSIIIVILTKIQYIVNYILSYI